MMHCFELFSVPPPPEVLAHALAIANDLKKKKKLLLWYFGGQTQFPQEKNEKGLEETSLEVAPWYLTVRSNKISKLKKLSLVPN